MRDRAAHNAAIIENRSVIGDHAHRTARHLRALYHAASREIEHRRKPKQKHSHLQPDPEQDGAPTLEGFIAFAGLSPADKTYNWVDSDTCPVARYADSLGLDYIDVSRMPIPTPRCWTLDEPFTLDYLTLMAQPHTYEAALDFARSLVTSGTNAGTLAGTIERVAS